ncbi:hypothetical protein [Kribbella sp. NBC_01245]|uniref:hypothetical protein n=1 Tax=Kribbella sp. NBC_01245 TaxID=2903578 RepID=UPI002E2895F2|nr:hypothetical protein [Kribbella sp. NBC_01245]
MQLRSFPTLEDDMLIDCDACVMRGPECRDCVVSVVLGLHAERHQSLVIDDEELAALDALAESGLVPPLRLVHAVDNPLDYDDTPEHGPTRRHA